MALVAAAWFEALSFSMWQPGSQEVCVESLKMMELVQFLLSLKRTRNQTQSMGCKVVGSQVVIFKK